MCKRRGLVYGFHVVKPFFVKKAVLDGIFFYKFFKVLNLFYTILSFLFILHKLNKIIVDINVQANC